MPISRYLFSALVICGLLLTQLAHAQILPSATLAEEAPRSCVTRPSSSVFLPVEEKEAVLLYSLPRNLLSPTGSEVSIQVTAAGGPTVVESFFFAPATDPINKTFLAPPRNSKDDQEVAVFEFLDTETRLRSQILQMKEAHPDLEVEITVDSVVVLRFSLEEFLANSDAVKALGVLPEIVESPTRQLSDTSTWSFNRYVDLCGNGFCAGGSGSSREDCETCPEDCASPCSTCGNGYCGPSESCSTCSADCGACPTCPTTLPNETRTVLIASTILSYQCYLDYFNWNSSSMYEYTKLDYKRYTVLRVRECNGSITETAVPGTTTYFSNYCYRFRGWYCGGGFPYPPACVFF